MSGTTDPEEIIKWKWDLKKLYISIPKKSGWGYRLNYAPGAKEKKTKLIEESKPKEKWKPNYFEILNMFLASEGLKPVNEEPDNRPIVDDLSPRPTRGNQ